MAKYKHLPAWLFSSFLLLFAGCASCQAQGNARLNGLHVATRGHYGFIMPHHRWASYITESHFTMYEVDIYKHTFGKRDWEKLYHYPDVGACFLHSSLGSSTLIGHVFGLIPYISFPLHPDGKIRQQLRVGSGIGITEKKFDPYTNYKNAVIGSRLNNCTNLLYELKFNYNRFVFSGGAGLTHFSNGSLKKPNRGINIPTLHAALAYRIKQMDVTPERQTESTHPDKAENKWTMLFCYGRHDLYLDDDGSYNTYYLTGRRILYSNRRQQLGLGGDAFFNMANRAELLERDSVSYPFIGLIKPGIYIDHCLSVSRLSLIVQMGVYLYGKQLYEGSFYHRLMWQYKIGNHFIATLNLKTHFARAEALEVGAGYTF